MSSSLLLRVFVVGLLSCSVHTSTPWEKCFQKTVRRSVDNAQPTAELFNVTPYHCITACIRSMNNNANYADKSCRSFVYDHYQHGCRLYEHDGDLPPAILHPADGFDFYRRVSFDANCATPGAPPPLSRSGASIIIDEPYSSKQLPPLNIDWGASAQPTSRPSNSNKQPWKAPGQPDTQPISRSSNPNKQPNTQPTSRSSNTNKRPDPEVCPHLTGYFIVIGNEIVLPISATETDMKRVKVLNGIEQSKCMQHCSNNRGLRDEHIRCSSINYFPLTNRCELHEVLAEPHGIGSLVENDAVIYAEKFCLSKESVRTQTCRPNEVFFLHVQQKIDGHHIATVSGQTSITGCLMECLALTNCKSASFDSESGDCRMHSVNLGDANIVASDGSAGTVIIENGCLLDAPTISRQLAAPTLLNSTRFDYDWSKWSLCQYRMQGVNVRVRFRNCPNIDQKQLDNDQCADGGLQIDRC